MVEKSFSNDMTTDKNGSVVQTSKEVVAVDAVALSDEASSQHGQRSVVVPMKIKITAVLLVTLIGFGGRWSGGITGAMKSTMLVAS
jgi:hypothetical protein